MHRAQWRAMPSNSPHTSKRWPNGRAYASSWRSISWRRCSPACPDPAEGQQAVALSRLVAARAERLRGSDLALSAQLGLVAYRTAPAAEAREALMDASALTAVTRILAFRGVVQAVVLSPDGHTLAAGGLDHQVALRDLRDPQGPPPLGVAPVTFPRPE